MRLVRASLLAFSLGLACGGADEPEDTTPASHESSVKAGVGGEVEVGDDGASVQANGEVKAGEVGGKAGVGAGVEKDDDTVKAGASGTVEGTTDADKKDDDQQKQQPLPQADPNQPNPEKPEQPPQPEQPGDTGTTP